MKNSVCLLESTVKDAELLTFTVDGKEFTADLTEFQEKHVLTLSQNWKSAKAWYEKLEVNGSRYYVYCRDGKLYFSYQLNKAWRKKSLLFSLLTKKQAIFWGLYSDIENVFPGCDNVYLNDKIVGQIKRPFKFWKFKHFAVVKVNLKDVFVSGEIHNNVCIGDKKGNKLPIHLRKRHAGMNYYVRKRIDNRYIIVRSTVKSSSIKIVNIVMQPEYTFVNTFKNNLACFISKIIGKKNIVLMFEKETNKANESGYYVFSKIMERKNLKAKVFFVINKGSGDFEKVKSAYPKNVVKKYSFKHYLYIYLSRYFVSSELSNHVINPRLYIRNINKEIATKPLVFLQHGIMFSKPIDGIAAAGFSKDNENTNYYKSVISSDLEATQFYKKGFTDEDLIKCGLPKFDVSYQNSNADKIMFMLTYRHWEEALVMNPDTIKDTTYYKVCIEAIKEFEKRGLLDKLLISCHPKFADCLADVDPAYENIIEKDINRGLENCKVFITDYSSASYDAHYRGAYIIYYWAEKDYLIENYGAVPPVDETNCDGVPVYSVNELLDEVENAIKKNYVMDEKYEERYKKINEFSDGKNGERLVDELVRLNII